MNVAERENSKQEEPAEDAEDEQAPASHRRGDFGISAAARLGGLERDVERLRQEAEGNPDKQQELRVAEKRLDLFVYEHDNAGAFKFKKFGREVMEFFEESEGEPRKIDIDRETGKMTLAESEKNRRVMFVNMGELDRVNKEGGHAAGDIALRETVHAIEKAVRARIGKKTGKQADYSMLRYKGNEFMVSFDDISPEDFEAMLQDIRDSQPKVEGVDEPVPLVTDGFDFQEAVDIVNQLQAELGPNERIDADDSGSAAREIIEVMRRRADWSLDVDKFLSRIDRVKEKIAHGGADEAEPFYKNYMEKMFKGTPLGDLEAFSKVSKQEAEEMAFAYAGKTLADASSSETARQAIVDQRRKEIMRRRGRSSTMMPPPMLSNEDVRIAEVPAKTRGQRILAEREDAMRAKGETENPLEAEEAQLDFLVEKARRDMGTGLLERGVYYEDMEQAIKEKRPVSVVFLDMGFLRYFDNKGGADVGDNALKVASELMEKAVERSGVKAKVYRYGGDEFTVQVEGGDDDVSKFNGALDAVRKEAGAIPAGRRGGADGYVPTELVFNQGVSDSAMAEEIFSSLQEAGQYSAEQLADPDEVANIKAELMTVIADKAIESEKASNRFMMLADALRDPKYGKEPSRTTQVDMLISFSNKALFAESGGAEFLRGLAASGKDEKEMRTEVDTWVADRVKESRERGGRKVDLLTELIEVHGKIRFYERALSESRQETEEERAKNVKLVDDLKRVRAERDTLVNVRKTLDIGGG